MNIADTAIYKKHLETLKTGILSIKPAGADGFEGLLRIALTGLTGIPFRLAASGLQGGMDGDAALQNDAVCFEAKRYSGDIPRNEVLVKIADLARNKNEADRLWVLGATVEVNTQLARAIQEDGDKSAVSTLVLDWTATPLPLLAIAVVFAGEDAITFINENYFDKTKKEKLGTDQLKKAFSSISRHPEFENLVEKLKSDLNVSNLALKRVIGGNVRWLNRTFSSKSQAKNHLGQAVAVLEEQTFPPMRGDLRENIASALSAGNDVILSGDEGNGKSWFAAQLCSNAKGLALFVSAEQLDGVDAGSLDEFLINRLIDQTGEVASESVKFRWRHRFDVWKSSPPLAALLVVIDGLNQRQNTRWDRLLNAMQTRLAEFGGRMIVTVRPQFWQKQVAPGLDFRPMVIEIPEWLPAERDKLLAHYEIANDWLDQQTLRALQNPRLLGIAVSILPHENSAVWKGLTVDRLLLEHLRASQRENFEDETFTILTSRLSDHAKLVLERVAVSSSYLPSHFKADTQSVIETKFYRALEGPGDFYELREEGLTLALGYALVDQLWQTYREHQNLKVRISCLIEPVNAMDRTADVLFASLWICVLDDLRSNAEIFSVLLEAFADLQNADDKRFEEFVEIIKYKPAPFFDTLKYMYLEIERRINRDWFLHAAFGVASTPNGRKAADFAIHRWLHCYNKDPEIQTNRYYRHSEAEFEKRLDEKTKEIKKVISDLSTFENKLLGQMTEVSSEPDELFSLALQLLAGRPLASFADSFVAMGLAFALDKNLSSARTSFQQLTNFNRMDRAATRTAFLKAIEPLKEDNASQGAKWTVVRMLYATGDKQDALDASILAKELRKDWPILDQPAADTWREINAADPEAKPPVDLDEGVKRFNEIAPDTVLQAMGQGIEDHIYSAFLPVACRFNYEIGLNKTQSILAGLITRTDWPLRQLILNFEDHLPLVDPELARSLIKRLEETENFATLPALSKLFGLMFAFYFAAAQLSSSEQLKCITNGTAGFDYLISVIPSFKLQPTEAIIAEVEKALGKSNEDAAYGALSAALYGQTKINAQLEDLILQCTYAKSSKLRAVSFQLAVIKNLESVRRAHSRSNWNATSLDEKTYEGWFGSLLLVEASQRGELPAEVLLKRITNKAWFLAAERLGPTFTKSLAGFFANQLRTGVAAVIDIPLPAADLELSRIEPFPFPFISIEETDRVGERFPEHKDLSQTFGAKNDFDEKQNRLKIAAEVFFDALQESPADLLIQEITIDGLKSWIEEAPNLLDELVEIIDRANDVEFLWLRNLAFAVGHQISAKLPAKAAALLKRASKSQSFLTQTLGDNLTLEHQASWGSVASEQINLMWNRRLLGSPNDEILAKEVLAAERFGAASFIKSTVALLASSDDSLDQAYALSIAGYSNQFDDLVEITSEHLSDESVSGQAARNAIEEHNNAKWANYWVREMWQAETAEDFWRCLVIAKTCMDSRVSAQPPANTKWKHFAPVFHRARKASIKARNKERVKRLVGQKVPEHLFIAFAS